MVLNLLAQGAMRAFPYVVDAAAGIAPTVLDAMLSAPSAKPTARPYGSLYAHAPSDDGQEEGGLSHPILDTVAGVGLGILAHKGMKAFPKMRAKGAPPVVNDPAKATPKASKPVSAIDDEVAEGGMSTAAEEAAEIAAPALASPFPSRLAARIARG